MSLPIRFSGDRRFFLFLAGCASLVASPSCGPTGPTPVTGPAITGNARPQLAFVAPTASFSVGQGGSFEIEWTDQDADSAATISFSLVNTDPSGSPSSVLLVEGIPENDFEAEDSIVVSTGFVPRGTYYLRAEIEDGVNATVEVFATVPTPGTSRIIVTVGEAGATPGNTPPSVVVVQPVVNLAVSLDDVIVISVQPTAAAPDASLPYDEDNAATLFLSLDLDDDPLTGDPRDPDPDELIALLDTPRNIPQGDFGRLDFPISVDLQRFPLRADGMPYFIRATIDDGTNSPRDAYATGTINVTRAAGGRVDLGLVGGTILGARWLGFDPGARLGTAMTRVPDFDDDGIEDCVLVAEFGTPSGRFGIGEAYLVYGMAGQRFGGRINVNAVGTTIEGATFLAPEPLIGLPVDELDELGFGDIGSLETKGLASVSFVPDLSGDGRPELLFGAPFVDGIRQHRDDDTGDSMTSNGCYPDFLPNNFTDDVLGGNDDIIAGFLNYERLGMVAMVNSENRDSDFDLTGASQEEIDLQANRLRKTTVPLDLTGQRPVQAGGGSHISPGLLAVAPSGKLEGARFQVAMFDVVDAFGLEQGPIRADFGARVASLPDIDNDQRPEIIISAPRNELDVADLKSRFGQFDCPDDPVLVQFCPITHLSSRPYRGNLMIYMGAPYHLFSEQGTGSTGSPPDGSSSFPSLDPTAVPGTCNEPAVPRTVEIGTRFDVLEIVGEKPEDMLGDGSSAGDFNLDGSPDVLCGAPFADLSTDEDVGTAYIVYMRQQNQDQRIELVDANTAAIRPPMIRIRGDQSGDRIGWAQEGVRDVNGDRIDDVVIASPFADAGGVQPSASCSADFDGDGTVTTADTTAINTCTAQFASADLSTDHECAFFDYDNDRDVDDDDVDVFECLRDTASATCCPVDNGVIAVVFGGITLDGDRRVSQIATSALPGVVFYGSSAGDRAGYDVASAGDFNRDGFGDLLISAPGAEATDADQRTRVGLVYLIFGGPNLANQTFNLDNVGTAVLPGIVFLSPYAEGAPDEAPPQFVAGLGDLDGDGFDDIGIGNPLADFVDLLFPQEPGTPGDDPSTGRRRDAGEIYLVYGNNVGG